MNIFLTGGTGFIGSYIIDELLKNNHSVTVLTRQHSKVNEKINVIHGDITKPDSYESSLSNIDAVFHNAAYAADFGKRKIMILSLLTCAPCAILFTFSQSFLQALLSILLVTATGIFYSPAYEALQADLTPKATRGRITALWQFTSILATMPGTIAGGFLFETVDPALPFYLLCVAEIIAALFIVRFVQEPEKIEP